MLLPELPSGSLAAGEEKWNLARTMGQEEICNIMILLAPPAGVELSA
jgi:hypothetical protein